jgi:hypothetical protein
MSANGFDFEDPNSVPLRQTPIAQIDQDLDDEVWFTHESNKRRNLKANTPEANFRGLVPEVESRSILSAAQLPIETKEGSTHEGSSKRAVGITASKIYSIAPSPSPPITHSAPPKAGEFDPPSNLGYESEYDR